MYIVGAYIDNWPKYRDQSSIDAAIPLIRNTKEGDDIKPLQAFLADFLNADPFNARLLLYLPFWALKEPDEAFYEAVRGAFYELLRYKDVRENFNLGDCFEEDARPETLDRVVKVVHIAPWLIKFGYVAMKEMEELIAERTGKDPAFCQSILDILWYGIEKGIFSPFVAKKFQVMILKNPIRDRQGPRYVSEKRKAWLDEKEHHQKPELRQITGPFRLNITQSELKSLSARTEDNTIIRLSGSRIKGYSREESDLDLFPLKIGDEPTTDPEMAHITLNTIWVGNDGVELAKEQKRHAQALINAARNNPPKRRQILEKMENDLLQYRLMHKGFPYTYDDLSRETRSFKEMDGESAFYDDRYRRVATELFLKYIFLP